MILGVGFCNLVNDEITAEDEYLSFPENNNGKVLSLPVIQCVTSARSRNLGSTLHDSLGDDLAYVYAAVVTTIFRSLSTAI